MMIGRDELELRIAMVEDGSKVGEGATIVQVTTKGR